MTTATLAHEDLRERIRASLPMVELLSRLNIPHRRSGSRILAHCPFHEERSPSFSTGGRYPDRAHCFGCGWDGDVFKFWQDRHGCDFITALHQLAAECGISVPATGTVPRPAPRPPAPARRAIEPEGPPPLPPLRHLRTSEIQRIALNRHLSFEGVATAAWRFKRIAYADWPQFEYHGVFKPHPSAAPSWCLTDHTRNTAEFRRIDGQKYTRADGTGIKAWSTRGKSWPIGAADLQTRRYVLLVEGGPDLLAAYHFLHHFGMLDRVGVVCMLGAANRIREDALPHFSGARVRIIMDHDHAGAVAAAKWTAQLTTAGAAVESFSLADLTTADGQPVKDLNDLAQCEPAVIDTPEITDAFCEWRHNFGG